jgi:MarR family transcriptional regulator for hemolysin
LSHSKLAPRDELGRLIAHIARHWRRAVNRHLEPFGLTEATWLPLLHISRAAGPMRQKELAASLSLDGSSVVRLLDELQSAGLVDRREAEDDRRAKAIVLTVRGRETVTEVERSVETIREQALRDLSDAEVLATNAALRRIAHALRPASSEALAT